MSALIAAEPHTGTVTPLAGFIAIWKTIDWEGKDDIRWAPVVGLADGEAVITYGSTTYLLRDYLAELRIDADFADLIPVAMLDTAARKRLSGDLGYNRFLKAPR